MGVKFLYRQLFLFLWKTQHKIVLNLATIWLRQGNSKKRENLSSIKTHLISYPLFDGKGKKCPTIEKRAKGKIFLMVNKKPSCPH